ncbi:hypothetical protein FZC75_04360 [Sutcliffiella horikoshii]|uniref:Uncharacterized protein n=1 Tax=Sutcliffiella horikoshii TaxID=79883 RepID=A0A5D4TFG5_9BACI|nr:hypothetical protein FZC75_04360 [Sutcliffiella horikoshii]
MRPLKRCEEAQAPSRGKRSHLRKGTAAIHQSTKEINSIVVFGLRRLGFFFLLLPPSPNLFQL